MFNGPNDRGGVPASLVTAFALLRYPFIEEYPSAVKLRTMPITIITPKPIPRHFGRDGATSDSDSDEGGGVDLEGDVSMRPAKRARRTGGGDEIVTPGEVITDDPQWMRSEQTSPAHSDM